MDIFFYRFTGSCVSAVDYPAFLVVFTNTSDPQAFLAVAFIVTRVNRVQNDCPAVDWGNLRILFHIARVGLRAPTHTYTEPECIRLLTTSIMQVIYTGPVSGALAGFPLMPRFIHANDPA